MTTTKNKQTPNPLTIEQLNTLITFRNKTKTNYTLSQLLKSFKIQITNRYS